MKRLPLVLIAGLCAGSIGLAHAQSREYLMSQARSIAISFGNVLKNELQTAMQSGGPVTAVAALLGAETVRHLGPLIPEQDWPAVAERAHKFR